jgi:hypothetical protein
VVLCGPALDRDGVSAWRIVELCRIAAERFGVTWRGGGMLRLVKSTAIAFALSPAAAGERVG